MMIIFLYSTLCYNVIIEATMLIALLTIIPSSTRAIAGLGGLAQSI